jgi:hypothetical protein
MSLDMKLLLAMNITMWAAAGMVLIGVFYGIIHAGKRYPLLALVLAAVLLWGNVTRPSREVTR